MIPKTRAISLALLFTGVALTAPVAHAGIAECNDLRLEDVAAGGCELRASVSCNAGCEQLGVYNKACATELHTVCRSECTLSAEPTCTDSCTTQCTSECDRGVNITCIHNCFGECSGGCGSRCEGADDVDQCTATCEATCDGECDIQCRPLVDGDCYTHCIECCDGSCTAEANMDCQTNCQEEEFTTCEREFRADCSASCDADGALFCNGEYMLSGSDLPGCLRALVARGTLEASVEGQAELNLDSLGSGPKAGCSVANAGAGSRAYLSWLSLLGVGLLCRRRHSERRATRAA
jgi:MYXO-CTERM domain-containing protein